MLKTASDYRLPAALKDTILEKIMHAKVRELKGSHEQASCRLH